MDLEKMKWSWLFFFNGGTNSFLRLIIQFFFARTKYYCLYDIVPEVMKNVIRRSITSIEDNDRWEITDNNRSIADI